MLYNGDFENRDSLSQDLVNWKFLNSVDICTTNDTKLGFGLKEKLLPQNGLTYIGLGNFSINFPNYREFIIGKLKAPLRKNHKYLLSFYVAYGSESSFFCKDMYAFFYNSIDSLNPDNPYPVIDSIRIPLNSKMKSEHWTLYQDTVYSSGDVEYIGIGNLILNDKLLHIKKCGRNFFCAYSYFFIDNISLVALQYEGDYTRNFTGEEGELPDTLGRYYIKH